MYNYFLQSTEPQYLEPFEVMHCNNANYTEAWNQDVPQNSSSIKNSTKFTQKNEPQINVLSAVKETNINVLNVNNAESQEDEVLQLYSCKSVALAAAKIVSETFLVHITYHLTKSQKSTQNIYVLYSPYFCRLINLEEDQDLFEINSLQRIRAYIANVA